jgi:branched-chain amino acid transport system substrate-binding protein
MPYLDDASKNVRERGGRYKEKFKEDPGVFSVYGYEVVDLFAQIAAKTGANLTTENFVKTIEKFSAPRDMFGSDEFSFTPTKHLGTNRARLSQIVNGKWTALSDYITE